MYLRLNRNIILLRFLLIFSVFLAACNSENINKKENTEVQIETDQLIDIGFQGPETASYSYIVDKEVPEIVIVMDTIDGIVVREPQINTYFLENTSEAKLGSEKEEISKLEKGNNILLKNLRYPYTPPYSYFVVNFENDVFLAMDYYFTNGVKFEYYHPLFERSFYSHLMLPYRKESTNYYGMVLVQNMYTPTRLDTTAIIKGDRPFASYLYLGFNKITYDPVRKLRISSEINIGILGPVSLGGLVQSSFHQTEPTGWQNQINNDVIINYNIDLSKAIYEMKHLSVSGIAGVKVGTLYDNIYGGLNIIAGNFVPYYNGFGLNCNHSTRDTRIQYGAVLSGNLTLVGYDATMQGGLFSDNEYYIEADLIKRLTHSAKFGLFFRYKWLGINANIIHLSHEFKGGRPHKWVHLSTTFCL